MSNSRASTCSSRAGSNASASAARAIRSSASLASISARSSAASASASNGWSAAPRSIRRAAWRSCASAPSDPPSNSSRPGQRFAGLEARLHRRALLGEARLLALLGRQRLDLLAGMLEPFAVALGGGGRGARLEPARLRSASPRSRPARPAAESSLPKASSSARWPLGLSRPRSSCWPWISTASAPMSRSSPAGTLAPPTKARLPPSLFSVRRTISGSPGSSVDALLVRAARSPGGPAAARFRRRPTPRPARPDQRRVGPRAERQAERVEQDRLAGAGLAGEHAKPGSNSSSSRSTSTILWMASCLSM